MGRRKLVKCDGKMEKLNLKLQLLADDSETIAQLQAEVTVKDVALNGGACGRFTVD